MSAAIARIQLLGFPTCPSLILDRVWNSIMRGV